MFPGTPASVIYKTLCKAQSKSFSLFRMVNVKWTYVRREREK